MNKALHKAACKRVVAVCRWAKQRKQEDLKRKLCGPGSAVRQLNKQLWLLEQWGETWQVSFAPEKMQAMVISRLPGASRAVSEQLCFGGKALSLQDHIKVLGMTVDHCLRFYGHVGAVTQEASLKSLCPAESGGNP
ncbi:hypothetical protein E2C01_036066 [Portunus trituberculatus]|uniref:Uncharacterized protein n=1 Tax=Portunus trituberculatus TaxID=210409 RepID=A0A5B7FA36_PORTR|nr:hypothetical protein [Portunus trituberculatus]